MTWRDRLRSWRSRCWLTQRQAAAALKTPYWTYVGWEQDRHEPPGCLEIAMSCIEHHVPRIK